MDSMDKRAEAYDRIIEYEQKLHEKNQRRIKIGIRLVILVPLLFLAVMFKMDSSKVVFLVLWIVSMFGISAYLITVEYADYKIQEQLKEWGLYGEKDIRGLVEDRETVVEKVIVNGGRLILEKTQTDDEWYEPETPQIEKKEDPVEEPEEENEVAAESEEVEEYEDYDESEDEQEYEDYDESEEVEEYEDYDESEEVEEYQEYEEPEEIEKPKEVYVDEEDYIEDDLEEEEISVVDIMKQSASNVQSKAKPVVKKREKVEHTYSGMAYQLDEPEKTEDTTPRIIVTPKDIVVKSPNDYANYRKMKRGKR